MDDDSKQIMAQLLSNASIGQLIMENHGEVVYNKYPTADDSKGKPQATHEQMVDIILDSYKAGLWWASTAWGVAYRMYCNATQYKGNMSAFERDVQSWDPLHVIEYECKADSFSKPLRKNPLFGSAKDWEKDGVDARMVALGKYIENKLFDLKN